MKKILLILIAILTISLTSCNSDDPEPSKKELLTDKSWKIIKSEIFLEDNLVEIVQNTNNRRVKFNDDNTGHFSTDEDLEVLTWSFSDSKSKLIITQDGETEVLNIHKLTNSKLTLINMNLPLQDNVDKSIMYLKH